MSVTIEQDLDRIVQRIRANERAAAIAEVCAWLRDPEEWSDMTEVADAIEAKFGKGKR